MENSTKKQISDTLRVYCGRKGSQNKAATSIGVSSATVSHMLAGEWELIKPELWRRVAAAIRYKRNDWKGVETRDYRLMRSLLADAQNNALVMAVTGEAGTGKSFAVRSYVDANSNAYLLNCGEYWNRKMFLQELLTTMGRDASSSYTVSEMMSEAVRTLKSAESPLIVLDEADKLPDQVLYFFITLYNHLEDHCAILLCATDHLAKRIHRGRKLNKKGYKEIYSRIGRRFIELKGLGAVDIAAVCKANGVDDADLIKQVVDDSEGDMRRVKRKVHAIKALDYTN